MDDFAETEGRAEAARGWERWAGELLFNWYRVSDWDA